MSRTQSPYRAIESLLEGFRAWPEIPLSYSAITSMAAYILGQQPDMLAQRSMPVDDTHYKIAIERQQSFIGRRPDTSIDALTSLDALAVNASIFAYRIYHIESVDKKLKKLRQKQPGTRSRNLNISETKMYWPERFDELSDQAKDHIRPLFLP